MRGRGKPISLGAAWPRSLILAGVLTALAPGADYDITTGSVTVLACPAGIETIELRIEAQPLAPVVEVDPSDNVDTSTVTICIHD